LKEEGVNLANSVWATVKNYPVEFIDELSEN